MLLWLFSCSTLGCIKKKEGKDQHHHHLLPPGKAALLTLSVCTEVRVCDTTHQPWSLFTCRQMLVMWIHVIYIFVLIIRSRLKHNPDRLDVCFFSFTLTCLLWDGLLQNCLVFLYLWTCSIFELWYHMCFFIIKCFLFFIQSDLVHRDLFFPRKWWSVSTSAERVVIHHLQETCLWSNWFLLSVEWRRNI